MGDQTRWFADSEVEVDLLSFGKVLGHFEATGMRPRFLDDLKAMGVEFPGRYFEPGRPQE